eukprot:scaffold1000_cov68-Phaeocystis_antarctica.AAC.7
MHMHSLRGNSYEISIRKRRTEHERLEASGRRLLRLRVDGARVCVPDVVVAPLWVQELVMSLEIMEQGVRAVIREEVIPLGPLLAPEHVVVDTFVEAWKVNGDRSHAALRQQRSHHTLRGRDRGVYAVATAIVSLSAEACVMRVLVGCGVRSDERQHQQSDGPRRSAPRTPRATRCGHALSSRCRQQLTDYFCLSLW